MDWEFEETLGPVEDRPVHEFSNGDVYLGQWRKGTMIRERRGACITSNGGIYEGYWRNDKAH